MKDHTIISRTETIHASGDPAMEFEFEARIHQMGKQEPYFAVTGESFLLRGKLRRPDTCGAMHEAVHEHGSEFAQYTKWHLFSVNTGPMHYIENAMHHLGLSEHGEFDGDRFDSHIVFGASPIDEDRWEGYLALLQELTDDDKLAQLELIGYASKWLTDRFDDLMDSFHADMRELFGANPYQDTVGKYIVTRLPTS